MRIRSIINITGLVTGLFLSGISKAQDYQFEVGFSSESEETDISKEEVDVSILFVDYYFDQVSTSNGPLAEAAFLSRASTVGFGIVDFEISDPTGSVEGDGFVFDIYYYIPQTNYFVGFETFRADLDMPVFGPGSELEDDILTAGMYLNDRATVSLSIMSGSSFGFDTSGFGFDYKRLFKAGGNDVNVEAGFVSDEFDPAPFGPAETNKTLSLSGDYYFNNQLSVGAGYSSNSGDAKDEEGTALSFDLVYFFTPIISLAIEVEEFSIDDSTMGEDSSALIFTVAGRI